MASIHDAFFNTEKLNERATYFKAYNNHLNFDFCHT